MNFHKVSVEDELPPATNYFDGNSSKRVAVFTKTFGGEESMNIGMYSYNDKKWFTLASGTAEVTHWLKGSTDYKI